MNIEPEPITLSELMAKFLPQWEIEALERMIVYIVDERDVCE